MADKAVTTYPLTEKALTDSEIDALYIYPDARVVVDGPREGYVYVMQETMNGEATGFYKVGKTTNVSKRRSDLNTGNVRPLVVT